MEEKKDNGFLDFRKKVICVFSFAILTVLIVFAFINIRTLLDLLLKLIEILTPIFYGLFITYLISPFYNLIIKLQNDIKNFPIKSKSSQKIVATIASVLFVLLIVFGVLFLLIPELINSIATFIANSNTYMINFRKLVSNWESMGLPYGSEIENVLNNAVNNIMKFVTDTLLPNMNNIFVNVYSGVMLTIKSVINIFIGFIMMIYLLNMKEEVIAQIKKMMFAFIDEKITIKILGELKFAHMVVINFLIGKVLDSLIVGIICYFALVILKMPNALLISIIVGITNVIPIFGPFIGAIPSFLLIIMVDPLKSLYFLIFILFLQQLDGNVIGPKVLGSKTGVKSLYVLVSIIIFGGMFGFIGMLIAVPLWAIITRIVRQIVNSKLKNSNLSIDTNDYKNK